MFVLSNKKINKTQREVKNIWPQEVLNPLLHFLSPQAPLRSLSRPPPSRLGRDLVTFECPIKRRGWVYPPPPNHTHSPKRMPLPPSKFFLMHSSPVCSASFPHKHPPLWLKSTSTPHPPTTPHPRRPDYSLSVEQEVTTVWSIAARPVASDTLGPGRSVFINRGGSPTLRRPTTIPMFCYFFWWKIKHCFLKLA